MEVTVEMVLGGLCEIIEVSYVDANWFSEMLVLGARSLKQFA